MNWADWAILTILLISCLISLKRGFVKEALSMLNWLIACFVAVSFREPFSHLLVEYIASPSIREIAAFAILFVTTLIAGAIVNFLLGELVRVTGLSGTDRFLGVLFGFVRGFIMVMVALMFVPSILPVKEDLWWQQSVLIPHLLKFEGWIRLLWDEASRLFSTLFG